MSVVEDMKKVAEKIASSYQSRISTVATIIDNTHQILDDFKIKRNEMNEHLKETLARQGSLRKKDFDNMMKDILYHQDEREKEVKELLKTFFEEQKEVAEIIKKSLTGAEKIRIDDFKKMLQDIQAKQKTRENEVSIMLNEFQTEYKELAESLRSLLDKRAAIRIKDFKDVMGNIRSRQMERAKEVKENIEKYLLTRDYANPTQIYAEVFARSEAEGAATEGGEVREKEEIAQESNLYSME